MALILEEFTKVYYDFIEETNEMVISYISDYVKGEPFSADVNEKFLEMMATKYPDTDFDSIFQEFFAKMMEDMRAEIEAGTFIPSHKD